MIPIKIFDETAPLETVILGTAYNNGPVPTSEETYDPKSRAHVLSGTYPRETDLIEEMDSVEAVFKKYGVKVYRPEVIEGYNQVFSRDIAFVIGDQLVVPRITEARAKETEGIRNYIDQVEKVIYPDPSLQMEGGDIILWNGNLFVGYSEEKDFKKYTSARTSRESLEYLKASFPQWNVRGFELIKSDLDPKKNVLHLDCCFQPLGSDKAIIYPTGFKNHSDFEFLRDLFGKGNIIEVNNEEAEAMHTNLFSIDGETVLSDRRFTYLNRQLKDWGFTVEEVKYCEVPRMGGSFRCSTLPLKRSYE